jgi:hypothetical protein
MAWHENQSAHRALSIGLALSLQVLPAAASAACFDEAARLLRPRKSDTQVLSADLFTPPPHLYAAPAVSPEATLDPRALQTLNAFLARLTARLEPPQLPPPSLWRREAHIDASGKLERFKLKLDSRSPSPLSPPVSNLWTEQEYRARYGEPPHLPPPTWLPAIPDLHGPMEVEEAPPVPETGPPPPNLFRRVR